MRTGDEIAMKNLNLYGGSIRPPMMWSGKMLPSEVVLQLKASQTGVDGSYHEGL